MTVDILGKRESMTVDVQYVCHTRLKPLILVSYKPSSTLLDGMVSGTSV